MTSWVLQDNDLDTIQLSQIKDALDFYDIPWHKAQVRPFIDEITPLGGPFPEDAKVIPYGSSKLIRLANEFGWEGMFYNEKTSQVSAWLENHPDMLNADSDFWTVKELADVMANVADDEVFFIRPNEDLKAFNGTVTTANEIRNWMGSIDSGSFSFPDTTLVAISSPKKILAELRWFIVGGQVIDGSVYKIRNQRLHQHEKDDRIINEAQELADKWLPHETCVMDIAVTPFGPKIIEFNCFNSAGFYYHDIKKIVREVTGYVDSL